MTDTFDYQRLTNLVNSVEGYAQPAMVQAGICGHLCAGGRFQPETLVIEALELAESEQEPDDNVRREIHLLYEELLTSLESEAMDFDLLLPGDDRPIKERLAALTAWASSFLGGFGTSGRDLGKLSEEAAEILEDMAAIAQIELDEQDEADEEDLQTVKEHVRLSAMSLFLELNEPPEQEQQPSLH